MVKTFLRVLEWTDLEDNAMFQYSPIIGVKQFDM